MIRAVFDRLEEILSVVLVAAMCAVVALQVFCRLVLRSPLSWSEELATILFVWVAMIGASLALKRGEHFAVELLHAVLGPRARRAAGVLVGLLLVAFSLILVVKGGQMAWRNLPVRTPAMEIPRALPYAAVPAGGALMLIRSLQIVRRRMGEEGPER